jgi:1-acyl-sn-glycerol-3-phosphate acyltransferase
MTWIWAVGAPLVRGLMSLVFRVRIEGLDRVPRHGKAILAPNHVSVLDGPALVAVVGAHRWRPTHSLITSEVFHGLLGWILHEADQIPVRRGTGDQDAMRAAATALTKDSLLGLFPEGHVNEDPFGALQRIRSGLTRLAIPTGAPVIPVGIWGTQALWPREGLIRGALLRRPRFAMVFGPAVVPAAEGAEAPSDFRGRYLAALELVVVRARSLAGD